MTITTDRLLSPADAAAESGYSIETIYKALKSGALKGFQPAGKRGHIRIPRANLYDYLSRPSGSDAPGVDWSEATEGFNNPERDFIVCDEWTGFVRVHASRLSEFFATKSRQGR